MLIEGFGESLRNRALTLRSFPALVNTEERALATIAEHARYRQFARGDRLFRAEEPSEVVYFIVEGLVRARLGHREVRVSSGHGVGMLAALCRDGAGTDATAVKDCLTLEVPRDDFLQAHEVGVTMMRTSLRVLASDLILEQGGLPAFPTEPSTGSVIRARGAPLTFAERMLGAQNNMIGETSLLAAMDAATMSPEVAIPKGETLWEHGAPADHLLRLDSGTVRCSLPSKASVEMTGPGTLGRLELLSGQCRSYDAVAVTDLHCFRFADDDFFVLLETHSKVGMQLLTTVARQLRAKSMALPDEHTLL